MKKIILSVLLVFVCFFAAQSQRSKVLAAFQLIENNKFDEAKTAIEDAVQYKSSKDWTKTWYARGLLAQTAYEKGIKEKDKKKYELYPDQLYVAYDSYQKSRKLDKNGRMDNQLAPLYVKLANDFLKLSKDYYNNEDYDEALKGFEHALKINQLSILSLELDTGLLYNTALAAYKSGEWRKASDFLNQLNDFNYSPNVPKLLQQSYFAMNDSAKAEFTLAESMEKYEYDKDLVLLYVDMLYHQDDLNKAITVLDSATVKDTANAVFFYTKGLLFQKTEHYNQAIKAYKNAVRVDPERVETYSNIASCFYNMAVEIEENARSIRNLKVYHTEKTKSDAARASALKWYKKAYEKDPGNQKIREQIDQLNQFLK